METFANHWLRDIIEQASRARVPAPALFDTIYSWNAGDVTRMLQAVREFRGTKVLVSCTDRTPLEKTLKQALSLADLAILVPAPLWGSCGNAGMERYAEFNYDGIQLAGRCHVAGGLVRKLAGLLVDSYGAFAEGAATFLPLPGESPHRWSLPGHIFQGLPCADCSPGTELAEAFYALHSEHLAAEHLGAMHLNTATFEQPVLGDFAGSGSPQARPAGIAWPDFSRLPLAEVLARRRTPGWRELSRALAAAVGSEDDRKARILNLTRQAAGELPLTTFALGSVGTAAIDFLRDGGSPGGFVRLFSSGSDVRLQIRPDSLLAAAGYTTAHSRTAFT